MVVNWPGSMRNIPNFSTNFPNWIINENGTISTCEHVIVPEEDPVPPSLIVNPAYLVLRFLMKDFSDGGKNKSNIFKDVPNFILLIFILHNFCENQHEIVPEKNINTTIRLEIKFHRLPSTTGYQNVVNEIETRIV